VVLFPAENTKTLSILRLAWAFWVAETEEVLASPTDKMDLLQMLDTIERTKGIKFAEGHNPNIDCIRLAFDPVVASHRPLIYYAVSCSIGFFVLSVA